MFRSILAMHEVQIVAADGQHLPWRFLCATGKLRVRGEYDHYTPFPSPIDRMQKLRERASHYHVAPEELVRVSLDDLAGAF